MKKIEEPFCPVPKGILLIVGGHEDKGESVENSKPPEILSSFIDLIRKKDNIIEVITTASSVGVESFDDYRKAFATMGFEKVGHIHHDSRLEAQTENLEERLAKADGIFFSGGDQLKLTSIYGGTAFLLQLKQRYIHDHVVIAGTSAGAMAMSTPMIYAGNKDVQQMAGEIRITVGLEFLKDICIDTHFVDRSRFVRMAQVIATNPTSIGIGIEEDTAVIVRNGKDAEVIGNGVVIIVEGFELTRSNIFDNRKDERIAIENLKVHILSKGSKYALPKNNPPHI
ncbi:cyanophycinase [Mucilaginibacter sp. UYP25]|uniref:cyanophycinase n=1 Tax=unclassified Mucilaginibacter TaxID=2617802 RepID=UPI003398CE5B